MRANGRAGYAEPTRQVDLSTPAVHERVGVNRIRGVARTRTTVVLSTKWEGRHG